MAFTARSIVFRRRMPVPAVGDRDPECAITARLERLATWLAAASGWVVSAPMPGLPPRRLGVAAARRGETGGSTGRDHTTGHITSRSA
jgi:hypothetical protein